MNAGKLLFTVAWIVLPTLMSAQRSERLPRLREFDIIPKPVSTQYSPGELLIPATITVSDSIPANAAAILTKTFGDDLGALVMTAADAESFVRFAWDDSLGSEAYALTVTDRGIELTASDERGAIWAAQTLCQMIRQTALEHSGDTKRFPLMAVRDEPKYHWRGFHWDVARHFFAKEYVMKHLERLSFYKINKFHIHLTDDQGWRIAIDRYPELTEIGGFRRFDALDTVLIRRSAFNADAGIDLRFVRGDGTYGGFYTKQDMYEIIAYAARLGIDVIPEIDMPGHMSAAIRAFPWLSCTGAEGWQSEFSVPLCASDPRVREFSKNVLDEIAGLFPYEYVHIGADEVEKGTWERCPLCRKMMEDKGMESESGLQTDFVVDMYDFLKAKGKKTAVWDDAAAEGDIPTDILVTYWRDWLPHNAPVIVDRGHRMVFMDWEYFYLSGGTSTRRLKKMYGFDITDDYDLTPESVIGLQACVWTEEIANPSKFEDCVWPSLQSFAEVAWGSERDWDDFTGRLPLHLRMMDREGIKYHYHDFRASVTEYTRQIQQP